MFGLRLMIRNKFTLETSRRGVAAINLVNICEFDTEIENNLITRKNIPLYVEVSALLLPSLLLVDRLLEILFIKKIIATSSLYYSKA